jgi:hypothetical protein
MLLLIAALACLVSVPLAGGQLSRLGALDLHAVWAVFAAAAIQVAITSAAPGGSHALHAGLHGLSYVLVGWFVLANRRLAGMPILVLGTALNALAIAVNGGVMPASATALRIAGIHPSAGFENSAALTHAHLRYLGDVIPVPGPWPIGNVLSVGDLVIVAGALVLVHAVCRPRRRGAAVTPPARPAAPARPPCTTPRPTP